MGSQGGAAAGNPVAGWLTSRRPAGGGLARRRLSNAIRPRVVVVPPPPGVRQELDVPVTMADGTVLRVNVFRPEGDEPVPVIMSAHPYGKDHYPARTRSGCGVNFQFRLFPQPKPVRISAVTSWEAPDPAVWVPRGFAVVNADLRGSGTSGGTGSLLSDLEARDYAELVAWAGTRPWSTGRVGLDGVSYLALSQYKVAALSPPHLAAICVWEGFSDLYRDFTRPGGVREDGFSVIWSRVTSRTSRLDGDLRREVVARPERDAWYEERTPKLDDITVPMLVCASFSDHSLHSRGSFEAFRRTGSATKWLYTHRDGKWSHYYGPEATRTRIQFFEHTLKGRETELSRRPPVRLAVHRGGPEPAEVTWEGEWPPADLVPRTLHLDAAAGRLGPDRPPGPATVGFDLRRGEAGFTWEVGEDLDVIGPMALTLHASLEAGGDANLFAGVAVVRRGRRVGFEGSYGFPLDLASKGWQRLAHRELDESLSTPLQPVHTHRRAEPLQPGEIVPVAVALLPHATRLEAGDRLVLTVRGRWHFPRNPLRGQFPATYERSGPGRCLLHTGGTHPSTLLLAGRAPGAGDAVSPG